MIEVKNLYLKYIREYYALYDINMKINKGECVGLVGEEGSGRTTLLRVLSKLEKFDKGEIYLKEINIKKVDFKNDVNLGYVSLTPVFLENKTVYDNFKYVLKERNYNDKDIEQIVNNCLIEFNLEKYKNVKANCLSLFEKYYISLIRLTLRPLDIVLVDDIFQKFADDEKMKLLTLIKNLFVSKNVTTLVASSDADFLKNICNRLIRFEYGSIV